MGINLYPVKIEAYDAEKFHVFDAEAEDDACAKVTLHLCTNAQAWPEMSAAILEALKMMRLGEGDA